MFSLIIRHLSSISLGSLLLVLVLVGGCGTKERTCFPECAASICEVCMDGECVYACRADQVCGGGGCMDVIPCDPACSANACETCDNGNCVSTCQSGQVCDNGACVSEQPCNPACSAIACETCDNGNCVSTCQVDQVCQAGFCVAEQLCDPACDANACEICDSGTCVSTCQQNQVCENGVCVADQACDPACDAAACETCDNGSCVSDCQLGQVCENGVCVAGPSCDPACDAASCEICDNGSCVSTCQLGQVCENGVCVADPDCDPACDASACQVCFNGACINACQVDQVCENGVCVAGPSCNPACDANACQVCFNEACIDACQLDQVCNNGVCEQAPDPTIYDIQNEASDNHPTLGADVTVHNVVVTAIDHHATYQGTFWVQEPAGGPYSGIAVFNPNQLPITFVEGDMLTLSGTYLEFFTMTNLALQSYTVQGPSSMPSPAVVLPTDINTAAGLTAEPWEGVLVEVQNVSVTNPDLGFGEVEVTGQLRLDDALLDLSFMTMDEGFSSIVGIHTYAFDNYKILPRYLGDLYSGQGCFPTCDSFTCMECTANSCQYACVGAQQCLSSTCIPQWSTIYDVQQGNIPLDSTVALTDVVVTAIDTVGVNAGNFWIQETGGGPYSGIMVYNGINEPVTFSVGDRLTVVGTYAEHFTESQIALDFFVVGASGAALSPAVIANPSIIATGGAQAEQYEGVLVRVNNLTVTNPDLGFGEFEVNGSLHIDHDLYTIAPPPELNDSFSSLTGVMRYNFDNTKLEPRDAADVQ